VSPRRRALGLWLVVGLQLAIPVSYYLRQRDPDDERFAWRMFSATRFRACSVEAFEADRAGTRPLQLSDELHASWIGLLRRGRSSVIEKFLARRCEQPLRTSAWLLRTCKDVGGRDLPRERYHFDCATRALSREAPAR
jgi:hypothetical protein